MSRARTDDENLTDLDELIALSVKERAANCRLLGSDRVLTLRASRLWDVVPGEIVTVKPRKQWSYAGVRFMVDKVRAGKAWEPRSAVKVCEGSR